MPNVQIRLSVIAIFTIALVLVAAMTSRSYAQSFAAGYYHSLLLKNDGTVWAAGLNDDGQMGTNANFGLMMPVPGLNNVSAVAAGSYHSLFLMNDGTVWGCGRNNDGQLGDGTYINRSNIVPLPGLTGIIAIAGGDRHSLFLKNDGTVWASGANDAGQLGDGTYTTTNTVVQVAGLTGVTAIAAGYDHSLFLKNDGTVWACGANGYGTLGDGTNIGTTTVVQVASLTGITAIAAGWWHSVFLKGDGTAYACGYNDLGQLGDGTNNTSYVAVQVSGLTGVTAVAAGLYHSRFLKNNGTTWACGDNSLGELTDGTYSNSSTVVQASAVWPGSITAITAGVSHCLFLCSDGSVWGCGDGQYGQQGNNRPGIIYTAAPAIESGNLTGVVSVAAGQFHSLFLKNDGTVWACGQNNFGELGDLGGLVGGARWAATPISGLTGITAISAGEYFSLFLKNDGTVWACGRNNVGQLGNGTNTSSAAPVQVSGLTDIIAIDAGSFHSLFLKSDGTVWACGYNIYGQLGNGSNTNRNIPVQVPGLTDVVAISAGYRFSLFLKSDGTVRACGENVDGQLGNGANTNANTVVTVSSLTGITSVTAGQFHSLFLKNDSTVWACGDNYSGALGDGTNTDRNIAVQVSASAMGNVAALGVGSYQSMFLKNNGTVWTCGSNTSGQMGDGTTTSSNIPLSVIPGWTGTIAVIAGGGDRSIFVNSDGTVWGWGSNAYGTLGTGRPNTTNAAVMAISEGSRLSLLVGGPDPITGSVSVCAGAATALSDAIPGGAWSSANTTIATVNASGVVTGIAAGDAVISYTISGIAATATVTVHPVQPIAGSTSVLFGQTITLSDPVTGGNWSSATPWTTTVTSATGVVKGISAGTSVITYTTAHGCTATHTVTVLSGVNACVGQAITISDGGSGGTWSGSNGSVATVGLTTGLITGVSAGKVVITHRPAAGGIITTTVTVNPLASVTSAASGVCQGQSLVLANSTAGGGTWYSGNTSTAAVSASGVVTGFSGGTLSIYYTPVAGCVTTKTITILPVTPITGSPAVCVGQTTALTNSTPGGAWSSSSGALATVSAAGVVGGVAAGAPRISYIWSSTGCYSTATITVKALSSTTGSTAVCQNQSTAFANTTPGGGAWSSANTAVAVVNAGIVTGIGSGSAVILFTAANGCMATRPISVNGAATITGGAAVCVGQTINVSNSIGGGNWSSSSGAVATVSASGVVKGMASGAARISYIISATGCHSVQTVTVSALSPVTGGTAGMCASSSMTLANTTPFGGLWSSSNSSAATVNPATGFVKGTGAGTTIISFTTNVGACIATRTLTVNACRESVTGEAPSVDELAAAVFDVRLFPNPNNGTFNLNGAIAAAGEELSIDVLNVAGQIIYTGKVKPEQGVINTNIALSNTLASGTYLLRLYSASDSRIFHFVIGR